MFEQTFSLHKNKNLEGLILGCQSHKKTRMEKWDQDLKKDNQEPCCLQHPRKWAPKKNQQYGQVFQTSREGDHWYGGQTFWTPARNQHYGQRGQTTQASTRDQHYGQRGHTIKRSIRYQHYGQRGQTIKGSIRDQHYGQRGRTIKGYIRDQQYGQRILSVKDPHFGQRGKNNKGTNSNSQGKKPRKKEAW